MLNNQTVDKLIAMKLLGMADALGKQADVPELRKMSFEDRLGLLVDAEHTSRENANLATRLKQASLRQSACLEDIDVHSARGLDRTTLALLSHCTWVNEGINILIDGKTGVGKSYVSTALAHKACRSGFTALYLRTPRLFQELAVAKLGGRYGRFLKRLAKIDVVVLDDFALAPITDDQSRDLLELVDDRAGTRPLIIASQLPPDNWYGTIPSATIADAILDRIIHGAHKLHLTGESRRKNRNNKGSKSPSSADSPIDMPPQDT